MSFPCPIAILNGTFLVFAGRNSLELMPKLRLSKSDQTKLLLILLIVVVLRQWLEILSVNGGSFEIN